MLRLNLEVSILGVVIYPFEPLDVIGAVLSNKVLDEFLISE